MISFTANLPREIPVRILNHRLRRKSLGIAVERCARNQPVIGRGERRKVQLQMLQETRVRS